MNFLFIKPLIMFLAGINGVMPMMISSTAFTDSGKIPAKYTCEGTNVNPAIQIEELPPNTKSLVILMDDPDAPNGNFDHWVVYNIKPGLKIEENSKPGTEGKNGKGTNGYTGPCPPSGTHHYHFKVYALSAMLPIKEGAPKTTIERAMQGKIVGYGEMTGTYMKTGK